MAKQKNNAKGISKTNAMRILESCGASFIEHTYDPADGMDGISVAKSVGISPLQVCKTLVTVGKSKNHYVFVVPVCQELDLKKAAKAVSEKSIEMIKQKELLPLTGYIHGGCSPVGMKKFFQTVIDESVKDYDTITVSAGEIGKQVELSLDELAKAITYTLAPIV